MNGKTARAIRKMLEIDLGKGTELKTQGHVETGKKLIGVISHDGDHKIREDAVYEVRTHPDRFMYRQIKKKYVKNVDVKREVSKDIKEDK